MVAVVSGNGLGLFNASSNTLHGSGQNRLGQAGGESYVNITNGNLVLRFLDEQLSGAGLDIAALRTYNSSGVATDGDGDNWRWHGERSLSLFGTANTVGSTITRTTGDGHKTVYNWNAANNRYESSEGDGAADFITWNSATTEWTWVDGSDLVADTYSQAGRLLSQQDRHGNKLLYGYNADGRLASVEDSGSKQKVVFTYAPIAADPTLVRLQRLDTYSLVVDAAGWPTGTLGGMVNQVNYGYDNLGRLTSVATDLTPGTDNSTADGKVYTTSYTYDDNSLRITSVTQSDGTLVRFTYHKDGGYQHGRIKSVEDSNGLQTFNYAADTSTVTNASGKVWWYKYDNEGRLLSTQGPDVNGQIITNNFAYDARDNLIGKTDGLGKKTTYEYDANDNCILERDALGNTITRTYDAKNQLLTETRYVKPDPDDIGSQTAAEPVTQRYVYSEQGRVRFFVSAQGRVTEYRYTDLVNEGNAVKGVLEKSIEYAGGFYDVNGITPNAVLSELQLATWVTSQNRDLAEVTQYEYDWRGNLKGVIQYSQLDLYSNGRVLDDAGATYTQYIYSEHGQLLQTIARRGENKSLHHQQSSVVYDGLGRQLSVMSQGATQTYAYNGANRTISVTNAAGLTTVSSYDATGKVFKVEVGGRKSYQYYDKAGRMTMTMDPLGNREYLFYDALGRIQFSVDALGAVTENQYDKNNRLISQTKFNNPVVNTANWFNGSVVTKTTLTKGSTPSGFDIVINNTRDRKVQYEYDYSGRLIREINQDGISTVFSYNGLSQLTQTNVAGDRIVRNFYDNDGNLIGTLDQHGYLRENLFDAAGRLVQLKRYRDITDAALRTSGSFVQLKASLSTTISLTSYFFYDAKGRKVGAVDEKGFLTETVYNENDNSVKTVSYKEPVTVSGSDTLLTLRTKVESSVITETRFDAFTRINKEVATDGTTTDYEYNAAGRLLRTIVGQGQFESDGESSSQRATRYRYNAFGELTGQVSGEGEATLSNTPTATELNQAIASYGEQRIYDAVGRVAQTIDANNNKTLYYYDAKGQLRFTVDATGAVKELGYNSFGQVVSTRAFNNRHNNVSSLSGGALTQTILDQFNALASPGIDRTTTSDYNLRGLQTSYVDAEGFSTTFNYSVHGQLASETKTLGGGSSVNTAYIYNRRGELTSVIKDNGGLNVKTETVYDAFGRITQTKDGKGQITRYQYDNSGRTITLIDPLNQNHSSSYDMLGRVLTRTDAAGNVTTYAYDDQNRSVRVTTPEGTSVNTYNNRHSQTLKVVDALGNTTQYTYNKNGDVTQITDALGQVVANNNYDNAGRLINTTDANGVVTTLEYDVLNRVFLRTVDPTDLNIRTEYKFNSHGDTIETIDAAGTAEARTTRYEYDRKGQLKRLTIDPDGLGLRTDFSYDARGNQISVSRGSVSNPGQELTVYVYDKLGRRTSEVKAFDTLNLITQYKYDANGNLTRKIDANGNSTWYVYDANNRQTHSVNQLGEVNETRYDPAGNVYQVIQYEAKISAETINTWATVNVLNGLTPTVTPGGDRVTQHEYDDNGRLTKTIIDPVGLAITTKYEYDANNNLKRKFDANGNSTTFEYDKLNRLIQTTTDPDGLALTTGYVYDAKGNVTRAIDANGSSSWMVYDSVGRKTHSINAMGELTGYVYDDLGNVTQTRQYNTRLTTTEINELGNAGNNFTPATSSRDLVTTHSYDVGGRLIRTVVDPSGFALTTEYRYDARGNLTRKINAQGNSDWYIYDAANRQTHSVNAVGDIKETQYTADGRVSRSIEYASALSTTQLNNLADVNTQIITDTSTDDSVTEYSYDAAGRLLQKVVDPSDLSITTQYRYDAFGNHTRTIDANNNSTWYVYDRANRQIQTINALGGISDTRYDDAGRIIKTVSYGTALSTSILAGLSSQNQVSYIMAQTNSIADRVTYYAYDKADRLRFSVDALGGVTENQYTANGKISQSSKIDVALTVAQLNNLNSAINAGTDTEAFLTTAIAASTRTTTSYTYDLVGRMTQSVFDPSDLNITTQYKYDALGRLTRTIDANGNSTWNIYNSAGNLLQTIDAVGSVTSYRYKQGQLASTYTHFYGISTTDLGDEPAVVASHDINQNPNIVSHGKMTMYTYDKAGRLQYETSKVDYNNHTTKENRYDAKGNLVATIAYDKYIYNHSSQMIAALADNILTSTEVETQLANLGYSSTNIGNARITRYAYDANDRLRFTIDAAGFVSENAYDGIGNILQQTDYVIAINATIYTEDSVDSLLNKTHTKNQTTRYSYDALGRLLSSTDALNNSEYNQYDRFGNKLAYTNKRGYTWLYGYDKANRLTQETSPLVEVAGITSSEVVSTQHANLITRIGYDLNGNVLTRTEGILRISGGAEDSSQARTTQYEYDKANRQTKTILAGWYDPATGKIESSNAAGRFQRTTEVTYDAMGNAVRNKIRTGENNYIYQTKVYDQLGRVTWDIDALNQVTGYIYDALGQQSVIYSYDSHIGNERNTGTLYTQNQVTALVNGFASRIIYNYFDGLGRKTEIRQERVKTNYNTTADASTNFQGNAVAVNGTPSTLFSYDALGNVTLTRKVIKGSSGASGTEYANQWSFYNNRNQKIQDVFDVNATEGYVTNYDYDAHGNLIQQTEFASKVAIPTYGSTAPITPSTHSDDRTTRFTYDQLNRQIEIRRNASFYVKSTTEPYVQVTDSNHLEQTTVYDAIGNIINQIDAVGNETKTQYDALGRATQIDLPARKTANASKTGMNLDPFLNQVLAIPLIQFKYNAFGQQIQETRSAGNGRGIDVNNDNVNDAIILTKRYDLAGNLIRAKNLSGNYTEYTYDVAGRTTSEQQHVSTTFSNWAAGNYSYNVEKRYEYDLLGHQTATFDIYQEGGNTKKSGRQQTYNRFGEVVADAWVWGNADNSGAISTAIIASYSYDDAGRLIEKVAADGKTRYLYDSGGRNTRVEQQGNNSAADGTGNRITEYVYDKLGRALIQRAPQFSAITEELGTTTTIVTPTVRQSYDRWGNIISRIDPNGSERTYTYNNSNQVTSETLPLMVLAKDDGTTWTPTIVKETHYDAVGRAVEDVQKANGVVSRKRYNEYNEVGQLTAYVDGTNVRTEYAYDAFGNKIGTRNGVRTVTVDGFDSSGNQLTHGILRMEAGLSLVNAFENNYISPTSDTVVLNEDDEEVVPQLDIVRRYVYDQANRRIADYDALNNVQYYTYDERGNLTKTRNQLGVVTKTFAYDYQNHKIRERDILGNSQSWNYNNYGQLISENQNLLNTLYEYNDFGQIATVNISHWDLITKEKIYSYKENGLLADITENRTMLAAKSGILPYVHWEIKNIYEYNIDGEKVLDKTIQTNKDPGGYYTYPEGHVSSDNPFSHELRSYYNKNGQLTKVLSPSGKIAYFSEDYFGQHSSDEYLGLVFQTNELPVLEYQYDQFGNRMDGSNFSYDVEGRILKNIDNNVSSSGTLHQKINNYVYDQAGRLFYKKDTAANHSGSNLSRYTYTDMDQIGQISTIGVDSSIDITTDLSGYAYAFEAHAKIDARVYERTGNLHERIVHIVEVLYHGSTISQQWLSYRSDGSLLRQDNGSNVINYQDYDLMGNLKRYTYTDRVSDHVNTYTQEYSYIGSQYRKNKEIVSSTAPHTSTAVTQYFYSSEGFLTKSHVSINGENSKTKMFANDDSGRIVLDINMVAENGHISSKKNTNFYVAGNQIARLGDDGSHYDFGVVGTTDTPINTSQNYVVGAGDTLQSIAQAVWGDGSLWYIIADANGINEDHVFFLDRYIGQELIIPNVTRAQHNNAGTFKPYNPAEIIGDTTPNVRFIPPAPLPVPSQQGCSKATQIILIVVIIVVAAVVTVATAGVAAIALGVAAPGAGVFTAGAAVMAGTAAAGGGAAAFGLMLGAAAIGGMAGNAASQGLKMAFGMQEKFDVRQLLVSGITSGFGSAAGAALQGMNAANAVQSGIASFGKGAAGYLVNHYSNKLMGVDKVAGMDSKFDWRDMVIAGAGATLSNALNKVVTTNYGDAAANFLVDYGTNFAGSAAQTVAINAVHHGKNDWLYIAADAFGNTVANSIVESAIKNHKPNQEKIDAFNKKQKDKKLEKALSDNNVSYHKDKNGNIVADDNLASYEFINGVIEEGGNSRIIKKIFKASPDLKNAIEKLNNYDNDIKNSYSAGESLGVQLASYGEGSKEYVQQYNNGPFAPKEVLLKEMIVRPSEVDGGALETVLDFGADGTKGMIKLYEENPFLATFAYEGTKAILSGGIVKPVINKLIKSAAGSAMDSVVDDMLTKVEGQVTKWVGDWANENDMAFELDAVKIDGSTIGMLSGAFTSLVLGAVLDGDIDGFVNKGKNIHGILGSSKPYNSRTMRTDLRETHGKDMVKSTTVPPTQMPNVKLAGTQKEITVKRMGINDEGLEGLIDTKVRVVFDNKGFPIFDDVAKYTSELDMKKFLKADYEGQMRMATRDLRDSIKRGSASGFNDAQLTAINKGSAKIPGYTWHHHQDTGRMQLVPEDIHKAVKHVGQESMGRGQ